MFVRTLFNGLAILTWLELVKITRLERAKSAQQQEPRLRCTLPKHLVRVGPIADVVRLQNLPQP